MESSVMRAKLSCTSVVEFCHQQLTYKLANGTI